MSDRRQIKIQDKESLCTFCKEEKEDLPHLFFICLISHNIWKHWYNIMGLNFALPQLVLEHFLQYAHGLVGRKTNDWWGGVLSSGFYRVNEMK